MGERKGTNLYYPPDYDPRVGGLNKFLGIHSLRKRASKIDMGILIIRFEMPYDIWCDGCGNHIGMGVRYNAQKKKIGMYYSTPLYQFRMKCHLCDNHFEIKTDPSKLDYVIVSGARRQENRWDPKENEQIVPETKEVSCRLYDDAMYKLEHGIEDKKTAQSRDSSLESAIALNKATWKDDYASNCELRSAFRSKKKELQEKQAIDHKLLKARGLNIDLVNEHEDDVKLAKLWMHKRNEKKIPSKRMVSVGRLVDKVCTLSLSARTHNIKKRKNEILKLPELKPQPSSSKPTTSTLSTSLVTYDSSDMDE